MDLIDVLRLELVVTALPSDQIPDKKKCEDTQTRGRTPVDKGISEEEVLDDCSLSDGINQTSTDNLL